MPKLSTYPYRVLAQYLGVDASGNVGLAPLIYDVIAPVATGVQATDTANLQAAINATPNGGWLYIPRGTYQTNAALSITQSIRISGSGVYETFTGNSLPDAPWAVPYLYGTVIVQNTAATDGITINAALPTVYLSDFGIMFGTSIWFANTGHGINVTAPVVGGQTYHQTSMVKSVWRNLTVFGHDGNHYGFRLLNTMINTFDTLRAYGGGIIAHLADNPGVNYGNEVAIHIAGVLMTAGTANGFHLQGSNTGTFGAINLMTFIRPQVNAEDLTAHFPASTKPTISQYLWFTDQTVAGSGASYVRNVRIISPDFEPDAPGVASPVQFNKDTFVDASGTMPEVAYLTTPDYNAATLPTATVQGGAGTGATASINGGPPAPSDLAGVILLHTGTSPGTGAFTDLVHVTFGTALFRTPKFITLYSMFASDSTPFMVHTFDQNGFTVMTALGSVVGTSKDYQIAWKVEP
jgi:hypothetical protein